MSATHQPTDAEEMSEDDKDDLLERLADRFADDPELSAALELASQASEESNS